jgi:hypothetical protein
VEYFSLLDPNVGGRAGPERIDYSEFVAAKRVVYTAVITVDR